MMFDETFDWLYFIYFIDIVYKTIVHCLLFEMTKGWIYEVIYSPDKMTVSLECFDPKSTKWTGP